MSARVGNVVDGKKNFFAERNLDDGAKNACGVVAEQVVLTHPARTDLQG